jgi:hypothetical protein
MYLLQCTHIYHIQHYQRNNWLENIYSKFGKFTRKLKTRDKKKKTLALSLVSSFSFNSMAKKGSLFGNLRQLDGYAKTLDDFRVKTTTGASGWCCFYYTNSCWLLCLVTVISALIILALVCSELIAYNTPIWRPSLVVDRSRKEKLPINFDITFHNMPCHSKNISPSLLSVLCWLFLLCSA